VGLGIRDGPASDPPHYGTEVAVGGRRRDRLEWPGGSGKLSAHQERALRHIVKIAVLGLAVTAALVPLPVQWVERAYSRTFYPALQSLLTPLSNRTAMSLFDLAVIGVVGVFAVWFVSVLTRRAGGRARMIVRLVVGTWLLVAVLYLVFLVTWGLNYRREPLVERMDFDEARVSAAGLADLARASAGQLNVLGGRARSAPLVLDDVTRRLGPSFHRVLDLLGQPRAVPARPKHSFLNFYFRRAAVDGMTDPYFLETLVRDDLLPFERPVVVAHEWAHLAGFAPESEASFVGWLTCLHGDETAQYSAWLFMYLQTGDDLEESLRKEIEKGLAPIPREDLVELYRQYQRQVVPAAREAGRAVYDRFLKANRVDSGVRSYDDVVRLALGTRYTAPHVPGLRNQVR
jgi:hypothetical protein